MSHCDSQSLLDSRRLRKTSQRVALLDILLASAKPVKAADLLVLLEKGTAIDRATVYRVLHQLEEEGMVRRVIDDGVDYFEASCEHNPDHPHFKCGVCGEFICLGPIEESEAKSLKRYAPKHSTAKLELTLRGTCAACSEKAKARSSSRRAGS